MNAGLKLFKVLKARVLSWDINRVEVKVEMKLADDAQFKTPDGTMPSGWEIATNLFIHVKGNYKKISISLSGDETARKKRLAPWVKKGLYAEVPALEENVREEK